MKSHFAALFLTSLAMVEAVRVYTQGPSSLGDGLISTKFTLNNGQSGVVHRRASYVQSGPPSSPIPGWSGLDPSWTPTTETESFCNATQIASRTNDYIGLGTTEDCIVLRDYVRETEGSFRLPPDGILPEHYTGLIAYNTCVVSVGLDPAANNDGLWVGNKDIADILDYGLKNYVKEDGKIFQEGFFPCSSPVASDVPATWLIW